MVTMASQTNGGSSKVQTSQFTCTVLGKGMADHVILEIVASLNDLSSVVQFDVAASVTASVQTHSAFTGITQQSVATGLAGSVRLLCGGNAMSGSSETEQALVASWMQAAEQTVLPMIRHGT